MHAIIPPIKRMQTWLKHKLIQKTYLLTNKKKKKVDFYC
jgi:hypothetical protein